MPTCTRKELIFLTWEKVRCLEKTGIVAMTSREERKIEPLTVLLTPEGQQRLDLKRGLTHRLLITQSDQMCHTEHAP